MKRTEENAKIIEGFEDPEVYDDEDGSVLDLDELDALLIEEDATKDDEDDNPAEWDTEIVGNTMSLYFKDIESIQILTQEEEMYYGKLMRTGTLEDRNLARKKLTESLLRYVVTISKSYANRGLDFGDIVQEGNIGVMHAVSKFDPEICRLSTYGTYWIRQAISRAVMNKGRSIRIPCHMYREIKRYHDAVAVLNKDNEEVTAERIAGITGLSEERIEELRVWSLNVGSLDVEVPSDHGSRDATTIGDFVEDTTVRGVEDQVFETRMREDLFQALKYLTPREREVLILRFGLDGAGEMRTLEEVGKAIHVTRERARQIEGNALRKLRNSYHTKYLAEYL